MKFGIEDILRGEEQTKDCDQLKEKAKQSQDLIKSIRGKGESPKYLESEADDLFDIGAHRRARTTITTWQKDKMEETFSKQRYPSLDEVEQLSKQLGLPQYVIKVWFQNRRAKFRKEGRRKSKGVPQLPTPAAKTYQPPYMPGISNPQHFQARNSHVEEPATNSNLLPTHQRKLRQNSNQDLIKQEEVAYYNTWIDNNEERLHMQREHPSPFAHHFIQTNGLYARCELGNCFINRDNCFVHECCCMECRLGTFYAMY